MIELKFDFLSLILQLSDIKMLAGDGFGIIIHTPLYMCADVIIFLLSFIITCIKKIRQIKN